MCVCARVQRSHGAAVKAIAYIPVIEGPEERAMWEAEGKKLYGSGFHFTQRGPNNTLVPRDPLYYDTSTGSLPTDNSAIDGDADIHNNGISVYSRGPHPLLNDVDGENTTAGAPPLDNNTIGQPSHYYSSGTSANKSGSLISEDRDVNTNTTKTGTRDFNHNSNTGDHGSSPLLIKDPGNQNNTAGAPYFNNTTIGWPAQYRNSSTSAYNSGPRLSEDRDENTNTTNVEMMDSSCRGHKTHTTAQPETSRSNTSTGTHDIVYYPQMYRVSLDPGSERVVGYDLGSNPDLHDTIQRALDPANHDKLVGSGRTELFIASGKNGMLLFTAVDLPAHRKPSQVYGGDGGGGGGVSGNDVINRGPRGLVVVVLDFDDIMGNVLAYRMPPGSLAIAPLNVKIMLVDGTDNQTLIYEHREFEMNPAEGAKLAGTMGVCDVCCGCVLRLLLLTSFLEVLLWWSLTLMISWGMCWLTRCLLCPLPVCWLVVSSTNTQALGYEHR